MNTNMSCVITRHVKSAVLITQNEKQSVVITWTDNYRQRVML